MSKIKVLVVDDDPDIRKTSSLILESSGLIVSTAKSGDEAVEMARGASFDVVLMDLMMPGLTGLEASRLLKQIDPDLEIIVLTGAPSLGSSLEAIRDHLFDYLCKPVRSETLIRCIHRAAEHRRLVLENRELIRKLEMERDGLKREVTTARALLHDELKEGTAAYVGENQNVTHLRRLVLDVAPSDATVLLRGESGTGKDVLARIIHDVSGRGEKGEFVKINCPAIPETLLESEMFGHEAGAFTGADRRKPGRFEIACGGTIFLDEIGDLPKSSQAKLLQVIEHKQFTRVGGTKTLKVNARIIAATNAPLEELIAEGKFRADLFYRINQFSITLPPLRERPDDIPLLADHFLSQNGNRKHKAALPQEVLAKLTAYDWPGNVRELKFFVDRFALTGNTDHILDALGAKRDGQDRGASTNKIVETEAKMIHAALVEVRWNQRKAAENLGISYSSLRRRIEKYGLKNRPPSSF